MTDNEMRIAIAEACGWRLVDDKTTGHNPARSFDHYQAYGNERTPDYPNDLNAMHEAEEWLFQSQHVDMLGTAYLTQLALACGETWGKWYPLVHATARQRAEAFLRTLGKWRD